MKDYYKDIHITPEQRDELCDRAIAVMDMVKYF